MFGRDIRRSLLYVVPAIIILCTIISTYRLSPDEIRLNRWMQPADGKIDVSQGKENAGLAHEEEAEVPLSFGKPEAAGDAPKSYPTGNKSAPLDIQTSHQEIFSLSTSDGKYYSIDFAGKHNGMNPNIIPHPTLENTWIVVAQMVRGESEQTVHFTELVCNAAFQGNVLRCLQPPNALPVVPTKGGKCEGDIAYFTSNVGPHDARVVYGPDTPYIIYGSNSQFTCFGQFIQDFRELIDWQGREAGSQSFLEGTEMQRPLPWNAIEKNWFPFWDPFGNMYIHYDVSPKRTFAQINSDGTVGLDLSIGTEAEDAKCIAKYYPPILNSLESIHQASNSLKITMCKRTDAICIADESNTFIFTIWQHKTYYNFHGVYEPYLMLFQEHAPFAMHAVSKKPLWFHGRQQQMDKDTSDMFYVTSIAWKRPGVTYHGYLDDELFIGFGIEDRESGAIDVTAEELMSGLGLCTEA